MDNVVNNLSSTAKTITGTVTKEGEMPSVLFIHAIQFLIKKNKTQRFLNAKNYFSILSFKKSFLPSAVTRALSHDKSH